MAGAAEKYREAVRIYAETDLSLTEIAERCNVSRKSLSAYIYRSHRDLLMKRNGIDKSPDTKLRKSKGQNSVTRRKYRDAIIDCDSMQHIDLNISEIARLHDLNPSALANQLRNHYPDVLERREKLRRQLGIGDNIQRGARMTSNEMYASAVKDLENPEITIQEAAEKNDVSFSGLKQHMLYYHKDLLDRREESRKKGQKSPKIGELTGNGRRREATPETERKFAEAVEMYKSTNLSAAEIARREGLDLNQFRYHLKKWHRKAVFERRGVRADDDSFERKSLAGVKQYNNETAEKYAEAIKELKDGEGSTESVAKRHGFSPEALRAYLKEHEPALHERLGMITTPDGKRMKRQTYEKYSEALALHAKRGESIRSIATRLNLNYTSLSSFLRRHLHQP